MTGAVVGGVCDNTRVIAANDHIPTALQVPEAAVEGQQVAAASPSYEARVIEGIPATMALTQRARLVWCEDAPWLLTLPDPAASWVTTPDDRLICAAIDMASDCEIMEP